MKTVDVTVIGSCILCEFCNQELVDDWNSEYVTCLPIWASKGAKVNGEEISKELHGFIVELPAEKKK